MGFMRRFLFLGLTFGVAALPQSGRCAAPTPPAGVKRLVNLVVLFADDLGYGDLACYGHPTIRTPHLDRMAAEGMKFTQFYSAAPVCTPSRAALLTGRLPVRTGMCSDTRRVLFPDSAGGLPATEITIAQALKTKGYATACIGKWHLGHLPEYLPTRRGFDSYFGIPYSNDMNRKQRGGAGVPLMRDEKIIEQPVAQETITRRYTEEAIQFITRNKASPFFLYLPYTFPHVPLFASKAFGGKSLRGLYGDVVEEIDWSVGRILDTLRRLGLAKNTLVFFTSDNGPWLTMNLRGGSAGLLRGGKGSTWEGGVREPAIAWWPETIRSGSIAAALASTMDIFGTALALAGIPLPSDRVIDGRNLLPVLLGTGACRRQALVYYRGTKLMAVRTGPWKAHFFTEPGYGGIRKKHDPPLLFHLEHDPSERNECGTGHEEVIAEIRRFVARHVAKLKPVQPLLDSRISSK